jgi:hypothetical protein
MRSHVGEKPWGGFIQSELEDFEVMLKIPHFCEKPHSGGYFIYKRGKQGRINHALK